MPCWKPNARPARPTGRALRFAGWLAPVCAVALAGCGPKPDVFAPPCPDLRLLKDGADLRRFNGRGTDVTDMLVSARLTAVPAMCAAGPKPNTVKAQLRVVFNLDRGPALPGRVVQVPYFISIVDGDQVLQEKDYTVPVTFPANVDKVTVTDDPIDLQFPVTREKSAANYIIYVSFRLSPDELAYNRSQQK